MWILPKKLHTSHCAVDTKALGLDSEEFSQICEKSLMWRSKPTQSRTWLQRWKRVSWIKHLSTLILKPSHIESFLEKYLSSQVDSHAKDFHKQVSKKVSMINDTYSHTSQKELESASQQLCFWKMSLESSVATPTRENQFSNMSSEHWKKWVTEQRQEYSQRAKLAHLINAKESSSWATPTTEAAHHRNKMPPAAGKTRGYDLTMQIQKEKNWGTPRVGGVDESWETAEKRGRPSNLYAQMDKIQKEKNWRTPKEQDSRAAMNDRGKHNLGEQVHGIYNYPTPNVMDEEKHRLKGNSQASKWLSALARKGELQNYPTPRTSDAEGGQVEAKMDSKGQFYRENKKGERWSVKLRDAVETMEQKNWATPIANDAKGSDYAGTKENPKGLYLGGQVKNWATPRANATDSTRPNGKGGIPLAAQVKDQGKNYPTARARDWKDTPGCAPSKIGDVSLPRKGYSQQEQMNHNTSGKNQESLRLNPSWVEQLMGVPVGWTQIE